MDRMQLKQWLACAGLSSLIVLSPSADASRCPDHAPLCRPYFGDTHIHTSYSQDANWRMGTSQTTPAHAYRFARGERISLPPFDVNGDSVRSTQLERPLDFAVVADHAENMDMVRVCADPTSEEFGAWSCGRNQLLLEGLG